ncbi:MAG: hypothetical protein WB710_05905 [Stellaceae bacterium]
MHDGSPMRADATGAIGAIYARDGVCLLEERERTKCNHYGERNLFHFDRPQNSTTQQILDMTDAQHIPLRIGETVGSP